MQATQVNATQILVHLDASAQSRRRLEAALMIAREHGGMVSALYAVTLALLITPFPPDGGVTASILAALDEDRRNGAKVGFDTALREAGARASWGEITGFPVVGSFSRQALCADLLVMGQYDHADPESNGIQADFVESVLAECGKPAVVLPYGWAPSTIGRNVVIAWKPTREAAHAVSAALPFLQTASHVHIQSYALDDDEVEGERLTLDGYLKLHGIDAVWRRDAAPDPVPVGEALLSRCADLEADLLVMGCYGHSRAREWILGGTTRTILRSMTLPVLMSH